MQFTYVDAAVAVITLLSAFLAFSRGLTRELFAIGGWILAGFAAFYFAPMLEPLMRELPIVGEFLADNCVISMIGAFSLIIAAGLLILAVFTPVFSSVVLQSSLGTVDRMFGFLFGVARGVLLIVIGYMVYGYLSVADFETALADEGRAPITGIEVIDNAASKKFLDQMAAVIDEYRPKELPSWLSGRIDALMAPCNAGTVPDTTVPAPAADPVPTPAAPATDSDT